MQHSPTRDEIRASLRWYTYDADHCAARDDISPWAVYPAVPYPGVTGRPTRLRVPALRVPPVGTWTVDSLVLEHIAGPLDWTGKVDWNDIQADKKFSFRGASYQRALLRQLMSAYAALFGPVGVFAVSATLIEYGEALLLDTPKARCVLMSLRHEISGGVDLVHFAAQCEGRHAATRLERVRAGCENDPYARCPIEASPSFTETASVQTPNVRRRVVPREVGLDDPYGEEFEIWDRRKGV